MRSVGRRSNEYQQSSERREYRDHKMTFAPNHNNVNEDQDDDEDDEEEEDNFEQLSHQQHRQLQDMMYSAEPKKTRSPGGGATVTSSKSRRKR